MRVKICLEQKLLQGRVKLLGSFIVAATSQLHQLISNRFRGLMLLTKELFLIILNGLCLQISPTKLFSSSVNVFIQRKEVVEFVLGGDGWGQCQDANFTEMLTSKNKNEKIKNAFCRPEVT